MTERTPLRHMLILLPGIMGSALQQGGRDVWALSGQALGQYLVGRGAGLASLAIADDDWTRPDLGDDVVATRLIADLHSVPFLCEHAGYSPILARLTERFAVVRGDVLAPRDDASFFPFPYDWRRDCRASAQALKRFVDAQLPRWRAHSGAADAQVIIIGHSMGGLVGRAYVELLGGWRETLALITIGTPHRGALGTINTLSRGLPTPLVDLTAMVRSLTSVYQLLPTYRVVQLADGTFERVASLDLPGIVRARATAAREDFHTSLRDTAASNRADPGYRTRLLAWAGTRQDTFQSAFLADGAPTLSYHPPEGVDAARADGDGTVPRASALPADADGRTIGRFSVERHGWLTNTPMTLEPLIDTLIELISPQLAELGGEPREDLAPTASAINLRLEPYYAAGTPAALRLTLLDADAPQRVRLVLTPVGHAGVAVRRTVTARPGRPSNLNFSDLAPGLYQAVAQPLDAGFGAATPVHGAFEVLRPA